MTAEEKHRARQADRWLRQYTDAEREIRTCKRQLVRLRSMERSLPTPALDASPVISGQVSDVVGQAAVAIADAQNDLHERIVRALRIRREVLAVIRRERDARDRQLLELRYIEGMSYSRLAAEMDYYDEPTAWRAVWRVLARIQIA